MNEQISSSEPWEIDPAIDSMISSMLHKHEEFLPPKPRADYEAAGASNDQGRQIDIVCWDLGQNQNLEDSAKLKALRLVRKFCNLAHESAEMERDFDYPVLNDYWKLVDQKFMQLLVMQALKQDGVFYGDIDYGSSPDGLSEHTAIAAFAGRNILKAALVHGGSPSHLYYRAESDTVTVE